MDSLLLLAAESGHIGPDSPWAKLAVPIGILVFVGPVYLLLRSNLGTRLGYLVMSTSLWGATFLLALFWTFGAPGTPAFTGPQNLPGQELDAYIPVWVPFAQDSPVVTEADSPYAVVEGYPDGFNDTATIAEDEVVNARSEILNIFSDLALPYNSLLDGTDAPVATQFATAENGRPIVAVTFAATCQMVDLPVEGGAEGETEPGLPEGCQNVGDVAPDTVRAEGGGDVTLFAFYDAGNPGFPSYLMLGGTFFLFALHMVLLARDESRVAKEKGDDDRDAEVAPAEQEEQTPVLA